MFEVLSRGGSGLFGVRPVGLSGVICLMGLLACGACDSKKAANAPPASPAAGAARTGPRAMPLAIMYSYDDEGILRAIGIATGCKAGLRNKDGPGSGLDGDPVVVGSGAVIEDDPSNPDGPKLIKVRIAFMKNGAEADSILAWFRPAMDRGHVVKTLIADRYESVYAYEKGVPGYGIPNIETRDRNTGEVVQRCTFQEILPDSDGAFVSLEEYFEGGELVAKIATIRQGGTGFLGREQVVSGVLPRDYHNYEFVMTDWPTGRSPGFGGF